ncbi:unannotated protein [freshwater metagenome]|uniref:Unannotated protein n=1 Tax=freshwater metagenome TaxID=449393 RepID=A0A6J6D2Y1_9ZZZZ
MTGKHVCEETHGQREGPDQEGREKLDRSDQEIQGLWNSWGKQSRLEVAKAVVLDPNSDKHHPCSHGKHERVGHTSVSWHMRGGDYLKDVADPDEEDHCHQHGQVAHAFWANGGHDDLLFYEVDRHLHDVLKFLGHQAGFAASKVEQQGRDNHGDHRDQRNLVEGVERSLAEECGPLNDVFNRRELHASAPLTF